jgi:hypothetical protein
MPEIGWNVAGTEADNDDGSTQTTVAASGGGGGGGRSKVNRYASRPHGYAGLVCACAVR